MALSIKQEDHILSLEVTAYTSADQPVKHVAGSGEVYMDFDTAMEIIVVTVNAKRNTGYLGLQVQESVAHYAWSLRSTAGNTVAVLSSRPDHSPPPAWPISGESYRRVPYAETDDVKVVVCGSLRANSVCAIIVETGVGPLLTISGRCPEENHRGPWHRVS